MAMVTVWKKDQTGDDTILHKAGIILPFILQLFLHPRSVVLIS